MRFAGIRPGQERRPKLDVPADVIFEPNIEYTNPDNQHLQLDMARPKGDGPFPAIVCIHGGGFRAGIARATTGSASAWPSMATSP